MLSQSAKHFSSLGATFLPPSGTGLGSGSSTPTYSVNLAMITAFITQSFWFELGQNSNCFASQNFLMKHDWLVHAILLEIGPYMTSQGLELSGAFARYYQVNCFLQSHQDVDMGQVCRVCAHFLHSLLASPITYTQGVGYPSAPHNPQACNLLIPHCGIYAAGIGILGALPGDSWFHHLLSAIGPTLAGWQLSLCFDFKRRRIPAGIRIPFLEDYLLQFGYDMRNGLGYGSLPQEFSNPQLAQLPSNTLQLIGPIADAQRLHDKRVRQGNAGIYLSGSWHTEMMAMLHIFRKLVNSKQGSVTFFYVLWLSEFGLLCFISWTGGCGVVAIFTLVVLGIIHGLSLLHSVALGLLAIDVVQPLGLYQLVNLHAKTLQRFFKITTLLH